MTAVKEKQAISRARFYLSRTRLDPKSCKQCPWDRQCDRTPGLTILVFRLQNNLLTRFMMVDVTTFAGGRKVVARMRCFVLT